MTMIPRAGHSVLRAARSELNPSRPLTRIQLSALSRLLSTLAVLEQREGKLNNASLSAVTAGTKLGGSVTGFVAGSGIKAVAEEAAKVKGIEKVLMVENGAYDKVRPFRILLNGLGCLILMMGVGPARELCASTGGEHQEGRFHTYNCWSFSVRKESPAQGSSIVRLATDIRYH